MNQIASVILGFTLVFSISSVAMEQNSYEKVPPTTLSDCCKTFGAFYPQPGKDVYFKMLAHWKKSKTEIKQLASDGPFETVVVLGPGPGNDLPIKWLVKTFARVILIDAYVEPMKELIANFPAQDASITQKVEIVEMDLSGGYYEFLNNKQEEIVDALAQGFFGSLYDNEGLSSYDNLLKENLFSVDLARYKPDLVISSLVTSQLEQLPRYVLARLSSRATIKGAANKDAHVGLLLKGESCVVNFFSLVVRLTKARIQELYLSSISGSGTQKIYYADTQSQNDRAEQHAFNKFRDDLTQDYVLSSYAVDGWDYNDKLKVSHYRFVKMPHCASCNNSRAKLLTCGRCKKIKYCSRPCQSKHWPTHKRSCVIDKGM